MSRTIGTNQDALAQSLARYLSTHALAGSRWQNVDMPDETKKELVKRVEELTEQIGRLLQGESQLAACAALSSTLAGIVAAQFGEEAALAMMNAIGATLMPLMEGRGNTETNKFMNLMAERGYDPAVAFRPKKKAKAAKA